MTTVQEDVVTALKEDIESNIESVSDLKGKHLYIYSPDQLDTSNSRVVLPYVFFHYAGIQSGTKSHGVYFDVYVFFKSESLVQIKGNKRIPVATEVMQKLRKAMTCNKNPTHHIWGLISELPDFSIEDAIGFRQRWYTNYQISN